MDNSGKIVWARHSELQSANLKAITENEDIKDGSPLQLNIKDAGSCEIYPQAISHNSNGYLRLFLIYLFSYINLNIYFKDVLWLFAVMKNISFIQH